jgi:hypothetical protein
MKSFAVLCNYKIITPISYYSSNQNGGVAKAQFKAMDLSSPGTRGKLQFPPSVTMAFTSNAHAESFSKVYKQGDVVSAFCTPVNFIGRVFGKKGEAIHYPAPKGKKGRPRLQSKVRYEISIIRKGPVLPTDVLNKMLSQIL